jgi:hypothetical protein
MCWAPSNYALKQTGAADLASPLQRVRARPLLNAVR